MFTCSCLQIILTDCEGPTGSRRLQLPSGGDPHARNCRRSDSCKTPRQPLREPVHPFSGWPRVSGRSPELRRPAKERDKSFSGGNVGVNENRLREDCPGPGGLAEVVSDRGMGAGQQRADDPVVDRGVLTGGRRQVPAVHDGVGERNHSRYFGPPPMGGLSGGPRGCEQPS